MQRDFQGPAAVIIETQRVISKMELILKSDKLLRSVTLWHDYQAYTTILCVFQILSKSINYG
jgi:hypothetical protein